MSIPKIIHYCWFGGGELPGLAKKCMDSWKRILPEYELWCWNEDNFDINCNLYVKQAYDSKKYAFVADYVRLYALYNYGGIYMDIDVEVIRTLEEFLHHQAFTGFEGEDKIPTGIIGSRKHNEWIKDLLSYYYNVEFISKNGRLNLTTNVSIITNISSGEKYGLQSNNNLQTLGDYVTIYPSDYFCPEIHSNIAVITNNTYTIHHFMASWVSDSTKLKYAFFAPLKRKIMTIIGKKRYEYIKNTWRMLIKKEN